MSSSVIMAASKAPWRRNQTLRPPSAPFREPIEESLSDADTTAIARSPARTRSEAPTESSLSGDSERSLVTGGEECRSFKLVVKATFLELDEGPGLRAKFFSRKSKTDSCLHLQEGSQSILEPQEYAPFKKRESNEESEDNRTLINSDASSSEESAVLPDPADTTEVIPANKVVSLDALTAAQPQAFTTIAFVMPVVQQAPVLNRFAPPIGSSQERGPLPCLLHTRQQGQQQERRETSSSKQNGKEKTFTTVMMRNIPNNYTRDMLLEMLDNEGFAGYYDFLYLPMDFGRNANLGYAFVNLVDAKTADHFWRVFDGFSRWALPTAKVCELGWSGPHQGLKAHIDRYRNSPVMHVSVPDEFKPMVFSSGVRKEFPSPTRAVKPPFINSRR
eukprot:TRINITY_DN29595_c0_g1_i1.p1 TRINITY_DN29595_c0_g1~~TRINITY_DN29595_c0_g1_i1.p1  ORF type:complete len:389 (-),score=78.59 TRINITY_DN29595_c0_g1_i1:131-1297(-)